MPRLRRAPRQLARGRRARSRSARECERSLPHPVERKSPVGTDAPPAASPSQSLPRAPASLRTQRRRARPTGRLSPATHRGQGAARARGDWSDRSRLAWWRLLEMNGHLGDADGIVGKPTLAKGIANLELYLAAPRREGRQVGHGPTSNRIARTQG